MITHRVFRAGLHTYVIMTIIGGLPTLYGVWVAATKNAAAREPVLIATLLYAFLLVWAAMFRIEITQAELVLRSLFGGTKRIAHRDIAGIRVGIDLSGRGGILRLLVTPKDRDAGEISINAKVFRSEAVRAVLDLGEGVTKTDSGGFEDGIVTRAARKKT